MCVYSLDHHRVDGYVVCVLTWPSQCWCLCEDVCTHLTTTVFMSRRGVYSQLTTTRVDVCVRYVYWLDLHSTDVNVRCVNSIDQHSVDVYVSCSVLNWPPQVLMSVSGVRLLTWQPPVLIAIQGVCTHLTITVLMCMWGMSTHFTTTCVDAYVRCVYSLDQHSIVVYVRCVSSLNHHSVDVCVRCVSTHLTTVSVDGYTRCVYIDVYVRCVYSLKHQCSSSPSTFTSCIFGAHHFGWDFCVCDHFLIQPLR